MGSVGGGSGLGMLVDKLFEKSKKSTKMDQIYSPESISRLMTVIVPLQQYIDDYQQEVRGKRAEVIKAREELVQKCLKEGKEKDAKKAQNGPNGQNGQKSTPSTSNFISFDSILNHSPQNKANITLIQNQHNTSLVNGLIDDGNGMGEELGGSYGQNGHYFDHNGQDLNPTMINIENNSLTDQWLIKYCHIPDVVITMARYLASVPSATLHKGVSGDENDDQMQNGQDFTGSSSQQQKKPQQIKKNNDQNQFFTFFLMLKLEQQWVQHCINYINEPRLYSQFGKVFGQQPLAQIYTHNQGFLPHSNLNQNHHQTTTATNFTNLPSQFGGNLDNGLVYGSFFGHFPLKRAIHLSGPITTPTMLSLLQDLTTFEPTIITPPQQQQPTATKPSQVNFLTTLLNPSYPNLTAPPQSSQSQSDNTKLSIPIEQFFLQRYAIHTTFLSTFSTHISPLLVKLSTWDYTSQVQNQGRGGKMGDGDDDIDENNDDNEGDDQNSQFLLPPTYFQSQLTYLTCLYFLPQTNYWAEQCQIVNPELYLGYVHNNLNPIFTELMQIDDNRITNSTQTNPQQQTTPQNGQNGQTNHILVQQHLVNLSTKLIQLATRESVEMIWNYTQYYVMGLVYRYIALGETIEGVLANATTTNDDENQPQQPQDLNIDPQTIGMVCDSIDLLLGDIEFVSQVGHKLYTKPLTTLTERLIVVKGALFEALGAWGRW